MEQTCQQMAEQGESKVEKNPGELPDGLELVQAKFVLSKEDPVRVPTAVDIGSGSLSDPTDGTRVLVSRSLLIYMSLASPFGNLKIWKVTHGRFIFSTQEPEARYITAFPWGGQWYPVWMRGSDPVGVTKANMDRDYRVWQITEKFSQYFIRLQRENRLYLNAGRDILEMVDVGDDPDNTRNVTPLTLS